ncbi:hypothetical protein ACOT81_27540 [Streptomyces sp. WI04-05B]|uniref:hypothetical protein n=1 Tax=Streptomyces TaxID=1883 RepID=UPI0029A0B20D|nr:MULTISPECIES: hypothetical protein [unclassified Streptomyces]MDX2546697.1 hypothetical protein [Streptomyces sp. WI04-05B]MDX2589493.1 hypothetical protein [Streptomyces sp. WI04-05A]MDX3750667.1 hypothetical protein [Streptomyces sp. AK08-02]
MSSIIRRKASSTLLAVIDRQERVLLSRIHGESSWRPVKARVIRVRPSRFSVIHVLDPLFSHWFIAATPVVGRFDPLSERGGLAGLTHIFVVRQDRMRRISLRACAHPFLDADYVWHPLSDAEDDKLDVHPRELGPFLRGYLEGWIPDGFITLVE